jgi:hypothetical protein
MCAARLVTFVVLWVAVASAQESRPIPAGAAAISGRVTDAHSQLPLEGATLTLFELTQGRELVTVSDAAGMYRFDGIAAGAYRVRATHPGYIEYWNGTIFRTSSTTAGVIELGPDQRRERVDFPLARGGTIEGRITDDRGAPIANATVRLLLQRGSLQGATTGGGRTGADGRYVISAIPEGEYVVAAQVEAAVKAGANRIVETTFYPGVRRAGEAVSLHLGPREHLRDISFTLTRTPFHAISGEVVGTGPMPRNWEVTLTSSPPGTTRAVKGTSLGDGGTFAFDAVRAGRYIVWTRAWAGGTWTAAMLPIDLDQDRADIRLELMPAARVSGRVVTETGEALPIAGFRIAAALLDGGIDIDDRLTDQVEVAVDGRFELGALFGDRALRVFGLPDGWAQVRVDAGRVPVDHLRLVPGVDIDDVTVVIGRR